MMMIRGLRLFTIFLVSSIGVVNNAVAQQEINLAGTWHVKLDSLNTGLQQHWYKQQFQHPVSLPGTLDDAGIGKPPALSIDKLNKEIALKLSRKHTYIGAAWYSKEVEIPVNWNNKSISLLLERVIWNTRVWVDGKKVGTDESLSTAHQFNLSEHLKPGKHFIVIRIDNSKRYEVSHRGMGHAYTEGTQIIWNGIIGQLKLIARNKTHISNLTTYPNIHDKSVTVVSHLKNESQKSVKGVLTVEVLNNGKSVNQKQINVTVPIGGLNQDLNIPLGENAIFWEEFAPNIYTVKAKFSVAKTSDEASTTFGLREITNKDGLLQVNGKRVYLRGTLECSIFPLTGHPPMGKEGWLKVFNTAKAYGLNHIRFHSWCPPEAAFSVADSLGFYLQVELPFWNENVGEHLKTIDYIKDEAKRIREAYGNHPSMCLWSLGNELRGDFKLLNEVLTEVKSNDKRFLYATTTFTFEKGHGKWPEKDDEFFVTQYTKKAWVRGQGIFNTIPPDFYKDYTQAVDSIPVPIISHEIGQYSVYPNLAEIEKYKGVLDPLNFKAIKYDLDKKGMLSLAPAFTLSSGKFSALLYKEEIERALKTKGMSGFQLLDLHDFPGQGTATIGILDAFWDSKGLVTPKEHQMYCSSVVPLLRFKKATYLNTEKFEATAEITNYSEGVLKNSVAIWKVSDSEGRAIFNGQFPSKEIVLGNAIYLGDVNFDLKTITSAQQLTIELELKNTPYKNSWKIWVYPDQLQENKNKVIVTASVKEAVRYLNEGRSVLLNPDTASINGVPGRFAPVFWSPVHFPNQPGTMGILCNPKHPALADFPTEEHSNWQWWDLITSSKTMVIDSVPHSDPIIRVIDNFYKNRKMANVIEARVGKGKLILTSMDITNNLNSRPVARQMRYSLLQYMNSADFEPSTRFEEKQLLSLFK
ncbi:MAG: glycoside hydrolase family 2 protein [Sphingobacteriaceae bacterium]